MKKEKMTIRIIKTALFQRLESKERRERRIAEENSIKETIEQMNKCIEMLGYEEYFLNGRHVITKKIF